MKKTLKVLNEYFIITLGLALYALGWIIFIIPNSLVGGGVTGFAAVVQYCTGFNLSYTFLIANTLLLLIGLKVLGKGFGVKTIFAIGVTTLFLKFFPMLIPHSFINEFVSTNGKLLCAIIGGAMSGAGIGLTFTQGGSSGGTDIIALIVTKKHNVTPGKVLIAVDSLIIISSIIIPGESDWGIRIAVIIYGFIMEAISATSLDLVLSGSKQSVQIFIFSKKYAEIADRINAELERGVTVLNGTGWYSKAEGNILMVIARKHEYSRILKIAKEEDDKAFISIGSVNGVYGEGFERIKK